MRRKPSDLSVLFPVLLSVLLLCTLALLPKAVTQDLLLLSAYAALPEAARQSCTRWSHRPLCRSVQPLPFLPRQNHPFRPAR